MMSEKETNEQTGKPVRQVAPAIIVSSPAKRSSIDELYRDNPGKEFAYAPRQSSQAGLLNQGLVPVIGGDGKPLEVGNRVICMVSGDQGTKETAEQFKMAAEIAEQLRDKKTSSKDKPASPKKPVKQSK
jgi:hypothetical protein